MEEDDTEIFLTHPTSGTWTPRDLMGDLLRITTEYKTIIIFARAWEQYLYNDWYAVKEDVSRESGYVITYPNGPIQTVRQKLLTISSVVGIGFSDDLNGFEIKTYREHCTAR